MSSRGVYADGREYQLPTGWGSVSADVLERAERAALEALDDAAPRVRAYYDPDSEYAGGLLSSIDTTSDDYIDAADLFAVSTLSMRIKPRTARALLDSGTKRSAVSRFLAEIPTGFSITALDADAAGSGSLIASMESLYIELRTIPSAHSNKWVFASKLCARKRPYLFPVRDNVVCEFLKGAPLRSAGIGHFQVDLQVFAFLASSPGVRRLLARVRDEAAQQRWANRLEASDLRLLDVALWTKGAQGGREPDPEEV